MTDILVISNPQPFATLVVIDPALQPAAQSRTLKSGETWEVPAPGKGGLFISFEEEKSNKVLASSTLPEGTTYAELDRNTGIAIIQRMDPESPTIAANGLPSPVFVTWRQVGSGQPQTEKLAPFEQPGDRREIDRPGTDGEWVSFNREDGSLLSVIKIYDDVQTVSIEEQQSFFVYWS